MATNNDFTNARVIRSEILVDETLNSRKDPDPKKIDKLRDSIKSQGLIHPCLLIRSGQLSKKYEGSGYPYVLVAGFRRQAAMDLLATDQGLEPSQHDADYRIAPVTWTLQDALLANLTENLSREDLTTYELAMQCVELRDTHKLSPKDIAGKVKAHDCEVGNRKPLSEGHINNLIRCATSLHPDILDAWKQSHPKASLRILIALAAEKDQEAQLAQWRGEGSDGEESGNGGDSGGSGGGADDEPKTAKRPTPAMLELRIEQIKLARKAGSKDSAWCKGAIDGLRYAAGLAANIPGIKDEEFTAE